MKTVSDTLGSAGAAIEFVTKHGKKILVKPMTMKTMSAFEKWLESRAMQAVADMSDKVSPQVMRELFSGVSEDITKGKYAFGGNTAQEALASLPGITKLVSLMASIDENTAQDIILKEGEAFRMVLDQAIRQSLPEMSEQPSDEEKN